MKYVTTKFMEKLEDTMKNRKIADTTINLYITKLIQLNGKRPFSNLTFLKNTSDIGRRLKEYENFNTKRSYLTAIVSVLTHGGLGESKVYKELLIHYRAALNDIVSEIKQIPTGEMTKKQKDNWIDWKDILDIHADLEKQINGFTTVQVKASLIKRRLVSMYVLLSMYVLSPPRRNKDYLLLKFGDNSDDDFNLYDGEGLYFNSYKTVKTYGSEKFPVNKQLKKVLDMAIELFDIKKGDHLILNEDGQAMSTSAGITKMLNRIFRPKNISSSMIRHIYLTGKYGVVKNEMEKDAKAMGHSVDTQRDYVVD